MCFQLTVVDSVEKLETVHDLAEHMIGILFQEMRIQDVLQSTVQADLSLFLNVAEILMV